MKFFTRSMLFVSLLVMSFQARPAFALTFSNAVPFTSPDGPFANIAYGSSQSTGFSWTHSLAGIFPAGILSDAELLVTYSRTNLDELWQVEGLGNLASAFNEATILFSLPVTLLQDLQGDGILTLKLKELTSGADSFRLHHAILSGHYEIPAPLKTGAAPSVPEAGTMLYFAGMLGAFRIRQRFKRNALFAGLH